MASMVVVALACLAAFVGAAKIVALPYPGAASHVFIMAKIGNELATRGHDVNLVVADVDITYADSRTHNTDVKVLSYHPGYDRSGVEDTVLQCIKEDPKACSLRITRICASACVHMYENKTLMGLISDADLVLADMSTPCAYAFVDRFNIPNRVDISPVGFYDPWGGLHWGVPSNPAYVPQLGTRLSNKMNFVERLVNTLVQDFLLYGITPAMDDIAQEMRTKMGVNRSHTESARSSGMYLLNIDWATEFPRPITPVVKVVGPILPEPPQPLPAELAEWVESATNGVLVVSLGTLSEVVLTPETTDSLGAVFSALPINVLWKLQRDPPANLGSNVRVVKWFPQNDLLGHPSTRAFITHGGMNSVQEAAYHGVPMLGFPQFGDQFDNIMRMVTAGNARQLPGFPFDEQEFKDTILEVLNNPKYHQTAEKISHRMRDRLRTSTQESADWVEFTLRNENGQFLRMPSLDMKWYSAANLDVYATLLGIVLLFVYGFYRLVKRVAGRDSALALLAALAVFVAYVVA